MNKAVRFEIQHSFMPDTVFEVDAYLSMQPSKGEQNTCYNKVVPVIDNQLFPVYGALLIHLTKKLMCLHSGGRRRP